MNLIDIDKLEWIQVRCNNGKTYVLIEAKTPYDLPRVDATEVIRQFESRLAQAERERDAAIHDIEGVCRTCKHKICCQEKCVWYDKYEWRGVCPENTKEE